MVYSPTMKTIIATVGAVMTAVTLGAQEADEKSAEVEEEAEETALFEAGVDIDFFSAYIWRNAVQNDDMVIQPCIWADFTGLDPFWFGFSIWQNYDLTGRRSDSLRRGFTETDFNVHVGVTAWTSDDESMSLEFELGHEWYDNHFVRDEACDDLADTRELYLYAKFGNPVVDIYGRASWMYKDFGYYERGMHYELGLTKEIDLASIFDIEEGKFKFGADWNVNFGDPNYLYYLFYGVSNPYFSEDEDGEVYLEDDYDGLTGGGIGGTTLKFYLSWQITEWMALKGSLAYTGIVNGDLRQAHGDQDDENRDLLWGGLSLNIAF